MPFHASQCDGHLDLAAMVLRSQLPVDALAALLSCSTLPAYNNITTWCAHPCNMLVYTCSCKQHRPLECVPKGSLPWYPAGFGQFPSFTNAQGRSFLSFFLVPCRVPCSCRIGQLPSHTLGPHMPRFPRGFPQSTPQGVPPSFLPLPCALPSHSSHLLLCVATAPPLPG